MNAGAGSAVEAVRAGLAELNAVDVGGLPASQVRGEILELLGCLNQLTAALTDRVGSFDVRDLSRDDAQFASSTWLASFGLMSKGAALAWLGRARLLRHLPALAAGMRAGTVSAEQLAKVGELVRQVGVAKIAEYDEILALLCAGAGPREVLQACARILAHVDPDRAEPDPQDEFDRREITFAQLGRMLHIQGRLDPEGAAALQAAIDALMRPPAPADERSAAQRRADALVDLARGALVGTRLPEVGGERPHVGLLITPELLVADPTPGPADPSQPAAAAPRSATGCGEGDPLTVAGVPALPPRPWLNWVGAIAPQTAQRLACDSIVWRVVLDPRTGLPLDVGRDHRIAPWWMRRALWARDRCCRWPGCDMPAAWTDAHHLIPWWRGGITEISQLISLCRHHHVLVHEGRWRLTVDAATGEVNITRPGGKPYELGPLEALDHTHPPRSGTQGITTDGPSRGRRPTLARSAGDLASA